MADSATLRAELTVARAHGIPHSIFLSWSQHDQDMALALHRVEQEEEANRCSVCGGDARECQDPANQRAYAAEFGRCFRTRNVAMATSNRHEDGPAARSLVVSTRFHPELVKHST